MQVATWNVNSIRTRLTHVVNWLRDCPVDVLCLQETKVIDKDFPLAPLEELGYHLYIFGQKAYNGVAILSRFPLDEVSLGFTPILGETIASKFDEQKRVITGVIDNVRIINLYVPNGAEVGSEKYEYKLLWLEILKDYLETIQAENSQELCICGDFNIALEDMDIYDPKGKEDHIMSSPAERQALQDILSLGLKDAFRKFTTEGAILVGGTIVAEDLSGIEVGASIISISHLDSMKEQLAVKLTSNPRKLEKPSDHTPVIVEF